MTENEPTAPIQSAPKRVDLPASAAWRHLDARIGLEVLFPRHESDRYLWGKETRFRLPAAVVVDPLRRNGPGQEP
jgi:hypothetical protein